MDKVRLGWIVAATLMAAGCSASAPIATEVVPTAAVTVAPTLASSPTPEVTSSPMPTASPGPTAAALASLFAGPHVKPAVSKVTADIKAVVERNPYSIGVPWTEKVYLDGWKQCYDLQNGNANRESGCEALIRRLYAMYGSYTDSRRDPGFFDAAKEVYDYALATFDDYTMNALRANLQ